MKRKQLFYGILLGLCIMLALVRNGTADTSVSGVITSDTIWTLAGSPYIVVGDVQIPDEVTLTIEPGVVINYAGAYEILVKGAIIANGTATNTILFTSDTPTISSGATILKFESTDLSISQLSHIKMEYASKSIRIGDESEHNQKPKNTGILTASNIEIIAAEVLTDGYNTEAKLVLNNAIINATSVRGEYPRSESIEINNSMISNSTIKSESYNKGIKLQNCIVNNCDFQIGCCGANIHIDTSALIESTIQEGGGSPVSGPLEIRNSYVINTPIILPAAKIFITNSTISYGSTSGITFGNGIVSYSSIIGNTDGVGIEITGRAGYNIGGSVVISNSTIIQNAVGVKVTGANVVTVQNNNFFDNTTYDTENRTWNDIVATSNYWGTSDPTEIASTIFDYYDDINYGTVDYSNYFTFLDTTSPISPPTGLTVTHMGAEDIIISWDANSEGDLAGYKIYWDIDSGYSYANEVDVGNVTSHTLTGLAPGTYYIAVTAYDSAYNIENDNPNTIVNENQTNGHESWYASEKEIEFGADFDANPTIGKWPLVVNFTDESIGDITDWLWDLGDGANSAEQNPVHTYNLPGIYTVSLIVTASGTTYTKIKDDYITVNPTIISGRVSISIAGHFDLSVTNASIYIEETTYTTTTDNNGNFTFENVPSGTYTLIINAPDLVPSSQQITVTAGQDKIIDLPPMMVLTQEELDQAVANTEAAKDQIIDQKDQTISELNTTMASMFTLDQFDQAVMDERQRWDINGDNKITLKEAIHALQVVSGVRTK